MNLNLQEIVIKVIKYLVEGLVVAIACFCLPQKSLSFDEVALIGLSAAATFSILDTFLPSIAQHARQGTGLGIGFGLSGFARPF